MPNSTSLKLKNTGNWINWYALNLNIIFQQIVNSVVNPSAMTILWNQDKNLINNRLNSLEFVMTVKTNTFKN